jgi:YCII-related domain-containing protein
MSKYLYLYRGPATSMDELTAEQGAAEMAAWNKWIEGVGAALLDVGEPCGNRVAVTDDGSTGTPTDVSGYSIVEAASLDAARSLVADHPFLSEGKGRFTIDVLELVPLPSM